ncbi:hypothetical protein KHA80_13735 [Anaerobacillus sp. HL2]|nr:hypothetical protein KHA80_13735 [Anaerobacillus sp. HL2]
MFLWLDWSTRLLKVLLPTDARKLNFVWLLDVFTFGLVILTGTGIASMAEDFRIATIAAVGSLLLLIVGLIVIKLRYHLHKQNPKLPTNQ